MLFDTGRHSRKLNTRQNIVIFLGENFSPRKILIHTYIICIRFQVEAVIDQLCSCSHFFHLAKLIYDLLTASECSPDLGIS